MLVHKYMSEPYTDMSTGGGERSSGATLTGKQTKVQIDAIWSRHWPAWSEAL